MTMSLNGSSEHSTRSLETQESSEVLNSGLSARSCAVQALAISVQDWEHLGQGDDPSVAANDSMQVTAERITGLLMARIIAVNAQPDSFKDFSTTTICRTCLVNGDLMESVSEEALGQLHLFVRKAISAHKNLPFHNFQHTYHVVLSANKLIDMMLRLPDSNHHGKLPPTYGLRSDAVGLMALIFSALIRDIGHHGVTNRQLVLEDSKRALLYNDQSVQEHRALHIAFRELLKDYYTDLRKAMFPEDTDYRYFRSTVVSSVLSTDLASPERSQISKSKWKEAFGEEINQDQEVVARRASMASNISMPRAPGVRNSRRDSMNSVVSDVTLDSQAKARSRRQVEQYNLRQHQMRRLSNQSMQSEFSDFAQDSVKLPRGGRVVNRRASTQSMESNFSDFAADSVAMVQKRAMNTKMRSNSQDDSFSDMMTNGQSESTFQSMAANSVTLAQKRKDGQAPTRQREIPPTDVGDELILDHYYDDDDASLSLTPPSSDDEYDGVVISGITLTSRSIEIADSEQSPRRVLHRRASTGNVPMRFGPLTGTRIDEDRAHDSRPEGLDLETSHTLHYQKRLGIRRSMDLSGESIELYSRSSIGTISLDDKIVAQDEPDVLKASVIIELLLRVAQSSHTLQGWENSIRWSSALFRELLRANKMGKGHDPRPSWFDNQVRIMESYFLPMTYKLEDSGVFGPDGEMFSRLVERNRERWLTEGFELTERLCSENNTTK